MMQDFCFDEGVAQVFDDMVQRSVPFYAELQRMTVDLATRFARPGTSVVDIGCSTGETLSALAGRLTDSSIDLVGVDNAPAMLAQAENKLAQAGHGARCRLLTGDVHDGVPVDNASVVIMNWTLQFVRPMHRDAVIRAIHQRLIPGGCLILMEKVLCRESLFSRLYIDLYYEFKERQGFSRNEISAKRESLENVLIPYRVEENSALLERNGFLLHDVFFRWFNWAGYLGIKDPTGTGE